MSPVSKRGPRPSRPAQAVAINRLRERMPGSFGDRQPRTLQRFVKFWRAKTATLLIDGAEAMIAIEAHAASRQGRQQATTSSTADAALGNITR